MRRQFLCLDDDPVHLNLLLVSDISWKLYENQFIGFSVILLTDKQMKAHFERCGLTNIFILAGMFVRLFWKSDGFCAIPGCVCVSNLVKIWQTVRGLFVICHPDKQTDRQTVKWTNLPKCKFGQETNKRTYETVIFAAGGGNHMRKLNRFSIQYSLSNLWRFQIIIALNLQLH